MSVSSSLRKMFRDSNKIENENKLKVKNEEHANVKVEVKTVLNSLNNSIQTTTSTTNTSTTTTSPSTSSTTENLVTEKRSLGEEPPIDFTNVTKISSSYEGCTGVSFHAKKLLETKLYSSIQKKHKHPWTKWFKTLCKMELKEQLYSKVLSRTNDGEFESLSPKQVSQLLDVAEKRLGAACPTSSQLRNALADQMYQARLHKKRADGNKKKMSNKGKQEATKMEPESNAI